ncbi:MAG: maleylacetoacetate isomerase [Congregibacter sp.]
MILYSYYRSSAAYRVRIALALKEIPHEIRAINLFENEQKTEDYRHINRQGLVPALVLPSGEVISQSGAILEWLEERYADNPLYPAETMQRATLRAICQHIACDIHPLNNLRVLRYLGNELALDQSQIDGWYAHWIHEGFAAVEEFIKTMAGEFSMGARPGMLEVYLVPQVFNARRFNVSLDNFAGIVDLEQRCLELDAFSNTHPSVQLDNPGLNRS